MHPVAFILAAILWMLTSVCILFVNVVLLIAPAAILFAAGWYAAKGINLFASLFF